MTQLKYHPAPPPPSPPRPSPTGTALAALERARPGGPSHIVLTSTEARALHSLISSLDRELVNAHLELDRLKGVPHP